MIFDPTRIREGMTVFSSDGAKLGTVLSCDPSMFVIEKGFFFPKDYIARYDDVRSIEGDDIHLALSKETFQDLRDTSKTTSDEGWRAGSFTTRGKPDTTTADVIGADYGLGSAGLRQPGMSDDLSRSARREATGEDVRAPVTEDEEEEKVRRRLLDRDDDLESTRRSSDDAATGTRRGMSEPPYSGKIPREDT